MDDKADVEAGRMHQEVADLIDAFAELTSKASACPRVSQKQKLKIQIPKLSQARIASIAEQAKAGTISLPELDLPIERLRHARQLSRTPWPFVVIDERRRNMFLNN